MFKDGFNPNLESFRDLEAQIQDRARRAEKAEPRGRLFPYLRLRESEYQCLELHAASDLSTPDRRGMISSYHHELSSTFGDFTGEEHSINVELARDWPSMDMEEVFYDRSSESESSADYKDVVMELQSSSSSEAEVENPKCSCNPSHDDYYKIVSNGEYRSVQHRVVANSSKEPRISIVMFFNLTKWKEPGYYGPLSELLTPGKPAIYRNFTTQEFIENFYSKGIDTKSLIDKITI
ncbi:codeine O-demethylase-like [Cornus florida]|uniref:codeine O-demethylase-like n=1 Tax=Cornus florida TaxID=4283 RepID=UPI00289BE421|nr:codeine O-demethylase-like [Cornus florida]